MIATIDHKRKKIKLPRPAAVVQVYNKFMKGVDKADLLISLYKTKIQHKKNSIIEYFSTFLLYLSSMHEQYIEKLKEFVHWFTSLSAFPDVSLGLQVTAIMKIKNHPKNEDQESEPIRFQMTSAMMRKTTCHFKLMVQLKDVNTVDALAEADSSARNARLSLCCWQ